jgi:hypothetical protein
MGSDQISRPVFSGRLQNRILRASRAKQFCYFESNPQNLVALDKAWFYVKGYFAKATQECFPFSEKKTQLL